MNNEQQRQPSETGHQLSYKERKRREDEMFNEYKLLDEASVETFNSKLNTNVKHGWRPYGKHAIYLNAGGEPHYTILLYKSSLDPL